MVVVVCVVQTEIMAALSLSYFYSAVTEMETVVSKYKINRAPMALYFVGNL